MTPREFDVIVLGAGPAGEVAAGRLGAGGLSVALVEPRLVGGECSFWACMPSKALLRPAQAVAEARRIPGAAEAVDGTLDVGAVLRRRDEVIHDLDDSGMLPWLDERGVTVVRAHGRLCGEREVAAGDDVLTARRAVVLATGTRALIPPIPGLREAAPWTNREITTAQEVPRRLLVLGGGVVGVEMAQAWASLGSEVTIVEAVDRVLAREEPFVSEQVTTALRTGGVAVRTGVKAAEAARDDGGVTLRLEDGTELHADELLCAIGRQPNSDDVGLDALGLEPGRSVEVREDLTVPGHPWLYAIGDVNGRALLTHMGKEQARIAADRILGRDPRATPAAIDGPRSPRVVFTDPQVAAVGHTEASAREAGLDVRVVDVGTGANAGGSFYGRGADGTFRIVVDEARGVLAGVTITGVDVQDMLQAATFAVAAEVPVRTLVHAVAAFPTRSEAWLRALEEYGL